MFKNYKKFIIIFSIILILFITISSISATENSSRELLLQNSPVNESELYSEDVNENILADNSHTNVLDKSSDEIVSSNSNDNEILHVSENLDADNKNKHELIYQSTHAECSAVTQKFSSGNIVYKVSLYDFVNYDGIKYKQPKYGQKVNLRVYTGNIYKNYHGTVGNDGKALINIPNLSIGTHKVEVYYGNDKKATSSIKVIKSTTKVYAPVKTIKTLIIK